jgi:hypothetical protein
MTFRARLLCGFAVLAFGGVAGMAAGPASIVPCSNVSYAAAVADARKVVAGHSGRILVRMGGDSMQPFFGVNSLAVVQPIAASRLRPGMIVVYVNGDGEKVAHQACAPVAGGWQVRGICNSRADSAIVDDRNLVGVVYAIFATAGQAEGTMVADAGAISDLPLVIGAPAR